MNYRLEDYHPGHSRKWYWSIKIAAWLLIAAIGLGLLVGLGLLYRLSPWLAIGFLIGVLAYRLRH